MLQVANGATLTFVGVQSDPSTVQTSNAKLIVFGSLITQVPSGGYIQINAPNEVSVRSGTLTCSFVLPSNGGISSCSASGRRITIFLNRVLPADAFEIHINSVLTNPTSTTPTSTFSLFTYTSTNTVVDSLDSNIFLTATEGSMQSASLTPTSQIVGASTTLEVRFRATHAMPAGGTIRVSFPKWNPSATSPQEYFQGVTSCSTVAVLSSSLQCSFSNSVLIVTGALQSSVNGGIEVAFRVTNFRNPISTSAITGFSILTQDSLGGNINRASVTVQVTTPATLTSASLTVDDTTSSSIRGVVQELNVMRLTFSSPVPLNQNCQVKVILPSQFSVSTVTQVRVSGLFGALTTVTFTTSSLDNSFSFTQCTTYTTNSLAANILISSLRMPNYAKPTSSLQVQVSNSNSNLVATVSSGVTFTPSAGSFNTLTLSAVNSVIQSTTGIQVTLVPTHSVDTSARLSLTFPSTYVLGTSCVVINLANTSPSAGCQVSGQTITINNLLATDFVGGSTTQIRFQINSITSPSTIQAQSGFTAQIFNQDQTDSLYYVVDSFTGNIPITITTGDITAVITPSSFIAYEIATYTFEITPQHQMQQNGIITIVYPSEITVPDSSFSQSQCRGFINFPTTPTCVINTSTRTISINNGFRLSTTPAVGTKYTLQIPGLRNPIGITPSSSFTISTLTSGGLLMNTRSTGLTITMTQSAFMSSVIITPASYVNAAVTTYRFQITPTVPVNENHYIVIQFPAEIKLPSRESQLDCFSEDSNIFISVKCTFNTVMLSNSIKATISLRSSVSQINVLQTFRLSVQSIMNPNTTAPTSNFLVQVTDKQFSMINRSPTVLQIATNTPHTLTTSRFTANATGAAQFAKYNITIDPEHDIEIGGGIYIVYPSQLTLNEPITAKVYSNFTTSDATVTYDRSARQILIRDAFQLKVIGANTNDDVIIELAGFRNPTTNVASTSFILKTFNEVTVNSVTSFYYIDQVTDGLIINSQCDYPCNTCVTGQRSNCTSCFTTISLDKLQGGTCVAECSTGKFYNTRTKRCEDCSYPCLGCTGSATNCSLCGYQGYLFLHSGACRNDCPSGFVTDTSNNRCSRCSSECLTCELTTRTCTSCNTSSSNPLFYQSTCVRTCPSGVSVQQGQQCLSCDPACRTCQGTQTNCTSCLSHMKYDPLANTCTTMCQEGTQIYNQATGICMQCDSNCLTCSGNIRTCTSCKSGQVLNTDNVCRSQCSSISQTPVNNICRECELPCAQCKDQANRCTKCQGDYLLFNTTCVQYCPDKYEANNATGQCILVGLICPDGFSVNEAGDGCIPNEFECPEGQIINSQRTACVPAPGSPVPFPFLFFTVMLGLLVLGSYIKDKFFTQVLTNLIALISMQEMLMYLLILAYSGYYEIWGAFVTSFVAVIMLMTANIYFYIIYKRDILKDEVFLKWQRSFPKTSKYIPLICLFINFKSIRLFYSGFYGLESCLAQFEDPKNYLFRPLRITTYFNYVFVYLPILVADFVIFATVQWGYQLLVLGVETFLLTVLIIVLTYFEMKNPEKLVHSGDEQYTRIKPRSFINDTMVMGGMVDVDETTLIRGKVVDDEYEVFLRKKAFVSILNQVNKNYFTAQQKGIDLGGKIDQVMTKFDDKKLKLRRAFSMEEIKEEDESWYIPSDGEEKFGKTKQPVESEDDEYDKQRRHSYPLTPRTKENISDPQFKVTLQEIKQATKDQLTDNVYADPKAPDKNQEKNRRKTVSRRTQTYLRELLNLDGEDLQGSDLEIVLEDEAELDGDYTKGLLDNIIEGISESESNVGGKRRGKKKRKNLNTKRAKEIPDFELADIMGDFEIDDLGNFIILRGEKGELLDKKERRVNRRGYLVDRFGNIINKTGQVIFKAVELDSDDEIPAPFGFEKRKKNLLNLGKDGEFRVDGQDKAVDDDEDLVDKELRTMKKQARKKRRQHGDGDIVEEEDDDGESSVDSLMAESPGKYQLDRLGENEDEIIANVTKKKVPIKRGQKPGFNKKISPRRGIETSDTESARKKTGPLHNLPPKRIKKDDTKDLFPSLAIDSTEQKKLFKIAEQIGGMANQIAEKTKQFTDQENQQIQNLLNQDRIEKLKQDHFKDIISESQRKNRTIESTDQKPPKPDMGKIYGNVGDVVNYEEQLMKDQLRNMRDVSPFSSQITSRMGQRGDMSTAGGEKRRLRGLESIYLQKFDKKAGLPGAKKPNKAKFRNTLQQFVDDPELLLDDGIDRQRQNEMSLMVADKLDRLQKQYMNNTATHKIGSATSMGFMPIGAQVMKKNGSLSGSVMNNDSLDPVKIGRWVRD